MAVVFARQLEGEAGSPRNQGAGRASIWYEFELSGATTQFTLETPFTQVESVVFSFTTAASTGSYTSGEDPSVDCVVTAAAKGKVCVTGVGM